MIERVVRPRLGEIPVVGTPVKFSRMRPGVRSPAPAQGQHTDEVLAEWGYLATTFEKGNEALGEYAKNPAGLILTDIRLPDISGLHLLQTAREINPDVAVVIMTGYASVENAVDALNRGANAYVTKPLNMEELKAILKKAYRDVHLSRENKHLIDNLQLSNRNLEHAKRDLERANRELASLTEEMEDLLRIVSHDLKSPLINIQGFTGRLKEQLASHGLSDPTLAQSFQFIQKGVQKMDGMIQSLLSLSRIGRRADPFQVNDLATMLKDIQDIFSHQLREKGIELIVSPLPPVWCRKNEINQVFSNLIANAINYMREKSRKKIEIRCVPTDDSFQFFVADTGIGIEEKDFEKVFKIFSRLEEKPVQGEGIGLTIVRKIIHGHGGRIWVESQKERGSTFCFTLPKEPHGTTQVD